MRDEKPPSAADRQAVPGPRSSTEPASLGSDPASQATLPSPDDEEGASGDGGDTPLPTPAPDQPGIQIRDDVSARSVALPDARYTRGQLLGTGGMGEVGLVHDRWVGRWVARKTLRADRRSSEVVRRRFIREMQVQGQLEHPAIVPVYDFGASGPDEVHFTMRRVRGPTLAQILGELRRHEPAAVAQYSRRKLLTGFVSVALAVHYAHMRGVLHRDLKPSNIMLGELGEVYVLDWGVAKVLGSALPSESGVSDITHGGALVGTPAYMAPEQLLGKTDELGAWTDVYALGLILYEILAGAPLHEGRGLAEIQDRTLAGVDPRPSSHDPDVPPELDAVCVRALALPTGRRYASAREMAQVIERFLDGDRDLEQRRAMAAEHAASAAAILARAGEAEARGDDAQRDRAEAMRQVVKALAFDPSHAEATRTLVKLLVEVPERLPAEAEAEMAERSNDARRQGARLAFLSFLSWAFGAPLVGLLGIRSVALYVAGCAVILASTAVAWRLMRRREVSSRWAILLALLGVANCAVFSAWLGPFVLVPTAAATLTLLFTTQSTRRERPVLVLIGVLAVVGPLLLEVLGVVPRSFLFDAGRLVLLPRGFHMLPARTTAALVYTSVAFVVLPPLLLGRLRDALERAERRLFLHAWHLRRLLPETAARGAAPPPLSDDAKLAPPRR